MNPPERDIAKGAALVEAAESRKKRKDLFTKAGTEAQARQPRHSGRLGLPRLGASPATHWFCVPPRLPRATFALTNFWELSVLRSGGWPGAMQLVGQRGKGTDNEAPPPELKPSEPWGARVEAIYNTENKQYE
jgi:hypothetical protein